MEKEEWSVKITKEAMQHVQYIGRWLNREKQDGYRKIEKLVRFYDWDNGKILNNVILEIEGNSDEEFFDNIKTTCENYIKDHYDDSVDVSYEYYNVQCIKGYEDGTYDRSLITEN